ncbi:ATP-binding protein [Maribacter dokdonensis]|uniref:ATP-binding protein n=1 Tax=Maribacter dokdonensis TaxID=320912 RepID=UPI002AB09CCA|nr:ATP-binding protein [Maribacter dokdonensis]
MAKQYTITIDFRKITGHFQIVDCLQEVFQATCEDSVHFNININSYSLLYADHLLLISTTVNFLREKGVTVSGKFIDFINGSEKANYASRINFFQQIGFNYQENFNRQNASGRFTEIKRFDDANSMGIFKEVLSILLDKGSINKDMLIVLQYCLWEVIDNSIRHSRSDGTLSNGNGYICCQYFPKNNQIRLIIADNGQGIHKALTEHPDSEYKHFSEEEAVIHCIDKGVTNSTGKGFGLWATSTLVKENGGKLIIHSGNHALEIDSVKRVQKLSNWQGTYTYLRVNTDVPVNYDKIFPTSTQRDSFEELKCDLLGNLDELW